MNNNGINSAWAAVAPILEEFYFYDIRAIVGLAGFDRSLIEDFDYNVWNGNNITKQQLISVIGRSFFEFANEKKHHFLNLLIGQILERKDELNVNYDPEEKLQIYLNRLGWQVIDNAVLPIEVLDLSDLEELEPSAREDLLKAATKFRDGDLSGAISSACAAVDSVTEGVYRDKSLGDVNKSQSFQERCNKSLEAIGVFTAIDEQLSEIDWKDGNVKLFRENLKKSLSQAAYIMQILRSSMSDAHGTKPVIKPLVFDSIKWSQIIVRLLSEKYDA